MNKQDTIPIDYESKYINVNGIKMHYLEAGSKNPPALLLHGIPTHSYMWRHVIPHISPYAKTIAIDLIGFGKSEKPTNIDYTVHMYTNFLKNAIDALNLKNIILVAMDLGLIVGLNYAMQNEDNIKGIVMFEGFFLPVDKMLKSQPLTSRLIIKLFKIKKFAEHVIVHSGSAVNKMMSMGTIKNLSKKDLETYQIPLNSEEIRRKIWLEGVGPHTISNRLSNLIDPIHQYSMALSHSTLPKLLLYAKPGMAVTKKTIMDVQKKITNLDIKYIGKGKHFLPEDQPESIGKKIVDFYQQINS